MKNKRGTGTIIFIAIVVVMLSIALPLLLVPNNSVSAPLDVPAPNENPINSKLYLTNNAGQILTDNTGHVANVCLYKGETTRFYLHNAEGAYTIKIIVNTNATETFDFYTSSGQLKSFYMQSEMTAGFDIVSTKDYFTITPPAVGMTGVLDRVYNTTTAISGTVPAGDLFAAVVAFEDGAILVMDFNIGIRSASITLSETEVVF